MRRFLLSSAALAALASHAFAADLPPITYAPAPLPPLFPVFTWAGFYIGVNGGYGGDEFKYPITAGSYGGGTGHLTSSGFVAGGQIGYNYQFAGPIVVGIEADFDYSSIKGEVGLSGSIDGTPLSLNAGSKLEDLGTVRGRLGYAWGPALLYATGGYAYGDEKSYFNGTLGGYGSIGGSTSSTPGGWTVGGGLEYALTDYLTVKAEYLYVDLDQVNLLNTSIGDVPLRISAHSTDDIVRAGLNYKFGLF